jgi:hypothetical protein
MARFELIATTVSLSSKEDGGEDRVCAIGRGPGPTGVIVCDGVGAAKGSAAAAEEALEMAAALISGQKVEPAIWNLDRELERNLSADRTGKTTMAVVCAEEGGTVGHLLIGNGSILEVVPMEVEPGRARLLWTSIALPQMSGREGKPALRSFLPPLGGRVEGEKGVRRATAGAPRLYLACSDGFLSEEDRPEGRAPDGTVWQPVPDFVAQLMRLLAEAWGELRSQERDEVATTLRELIEGSVKRPDAAIPLDDDTSVGALYMRPTGGEGDGE